MKAQGIWTAGEIQHSTNARQVALEAARVQSGPRQILLQYGVGPKYMIDMGAANDAEDDEDAWTYEIGDGEQ